MVYKEDPCKWVFLPELVEIYKTSTQAKLCTKVSNMPWIKYLNILDKLSELDQEIKKNGPPPAPGTLESVMCCWLKEVAPDKYCDKYVRAIHEFACAIGDKVGEVKGLESGEQPDGPCPDGSPCEGEATATKRSDPNATTSIPASVLSQICNCVV